MALILCCLGGLASTPFSACKHHQTMTSEIEAHAARFSPAAWAEGALPKLVLSLLLSTAAPQAA